MVNYKFLIHEIWAKYFGLQISKIWAWSLKFKKGNIFVPLTMVRFNFDPLNIKVSLILII